MCCDDTQQGDGEKIYLHSAFNANPFDDPDCLSYGRNNVQCITDVKTNSGTTDIIMDLHALVHASNSIFNLAVMCKINYYGVIVLEDGMAQTGLNLDKGDEQEYILHVVIEAGSSKAVTCNSFVS